MTESVQEIIEKIIPALRKTIPPVYFLIALVLMFLLNHFMPVSLLIFVPVRVFGGLLVILGLAVTVMAAMLFKNAGTPFRPFEKPTMLVTEGLYQYSRNPMYLGMVVILFGTWIALGSLSPVIVIPVFFFIIQEGFIREEEKRLEDAFDEDYFKYKEKVRRWL